MKVEILQDKQALGRAAARAGADALRQALAEKPEAGVIVATGASQFEMLDALVQERGIAWPRVSIFHLDEYVGLPPSHPASFRNYLQTRLLARLPTPKAFVAIDGTARSIPDEISRLNGFITMHEIAVCFAGIGENCHLAFNDPPADFETRSPFILVNLDEACRRQQATEGWFPALDAVPRCAITMSVQQIAQSRKIILSVPDARKAAAVSAAIEGPITQDSPASFLRTHADCTLYLDPHSASLLQHTERRGPWQGE
ncbi:glucosamine-6-phosphate deaminase [Verminephrobacter aporrectodeae subsp. tuberculatae]|uniref:6-phosphogluconolactonase n=1 Tax=Verminephrobacter aporrectodeae TaxID=1110389 RepID=UPI0022441412|nr:6-phosphogluconolactonase [Verminephrobacter aporrectodeae]MCW8207858.1 glucosamine-6-phosphate deaminase [Verminephrobacter aporrectodeae subsp. tuberculatae]